MSSPYRNHDAATLCGQLRTNGMRNKCYAPAAVKAISRVSGQYELFCKRHGSYVRKGQGASIFATLVRAGIAELVEVSK